MEADSGVNQPSDDQLTAAPNMHSFLLSPLARLEGISVLLLVERPSLLTILEMPRPVGRPLFAPVGLPGITGSLSSSR